MGTRAPGHTLLAPTTPVSTSLQTSHHPTLAKEANVKVSSQLDSPGFFSHRSVSLHCCVWRKPILRRRLQDFAKRSQCQDGVGPGAYELLFQASGAQVFSANKASPWLRRVLCDKPILSRLHVKALLEGHLLSTFWL